MMKCSYDIYYVNCSSFKRQSAWHLFITWVLYVEFVRSFWVHIQQTLQVDHVLVLAIKYIFIFIFIPFIALQFQKKTHAKRNTEFNWDVFLAMNLTTYYLNYLINTNGYGSEKPTSNKKNDFLKYKTNWFF